MKAKSDTSIAPLRVKKKLQIPQRSMPNILKSDIPLFLNHFVVRVAYVSRCVWRYMPFVDVKGIDTHGK